MGLPKSNALWAAQTATKAGQNKAAIKLFTKSKILNFLVK
jgi:hypothetical protein